MRGTGTQGKKRRRKKEKMAFVRQWQKRKVRRTTREEESAWREAYGKGSVRHPAPPPPPTHGLLHSGLERSAGTRLYIKLNVLGHNF